MEGSANTIKCVTKLYWTYEQDKPALWQVVTCPFKQAIIYSQLDVFLEKKVYVRSAE